MRVEELMTKDVMTCREHDSLATAARIMWECDCGIVPVVDGEGHLVGTITDRDVCMAAFTQGRTLDQIPVSTASSKIVYSVKPDDSLGAAEALMRDGSVRRLPVVDGEGRVRGLLSLADLARRSQSHSRSDGASATAIARTLAAISRPRA